MKTQNISQKKSRIDKQKININIIKNDVFRKIVSRCGWKKSDGQIIRFDKREKASNSFVSILAS